MFDWVPDTVSARVWRCIAHLGASGAQYVGRVASDPFEPKFTAYDIVGHRLGSAVGIDKEEALAKAKGLVERDVERRIEREQRGKS